MTSTRLLLVASLGLVPYAEALELQRGAAQARLDGRLDHDLLILLEHPPVVTLGRSAKEANLLLTRGALAKRGVGGAGRRPDLPRPGPARRLSDHGPSPAP